MGKGERKIRSDKKIPIGPFVSLSVYDSFEALKFITGQSIKQLGEDFLQEGIQSIKVLERIAPHFKNQFKLDDDNIYFGVAERGYREKGKMQKLRLQMRLSREFDDRLTYLAYCLATTKATAAGLLLRTSFMTGDILKKVVTNYVGYDLDRERVRELKRVIKFIQTYNPQAEETNLLLLFAHYIKTGLEYLENR